MFRCKSRLLMTEIVLVTAGSAFLMVMSLNSSIGLTMDNIYARSRYDALIAFARQAVRSPARALVVLASAALALAGAPELAVLAGGGLAMLAARRKTRTSVAALVAGIGPLASAMLGAAGAGAAAVPFSIARLGWFYLKVGSVLFGSGYVLLAFLRGDLVARWGWLTEQQLLDAVAVGQVTPGPLFTTATFIGYVLAGLPGAIVATVAIFAPAFVFVALTHRWIGAMRASPVTGSLLDGLTLASVGLMAAVTTRLAPSTLVDAPSAMLAALAFALLLLARPNATWLLGGGALAGWLLRR
jgi:chromate transporter